VRVVPAIVVALVATLVIHTRFYKLLRVPLPWGVLEPVLW
jgi:putative tricarboxylic transport membrane protein